ncbi:putative Ig domain-containing protein [Aromatoleum buckelii]|nr:putative Ig domain-containing protein [Aromatoleum buckelii]MCK0511568.1 putative Ig domain-containing protein [Aromatoleum buckelii]
MALGVTASLLVACGGGGGGGGGGGSGNVTPTNEYQISLRADHTSLPLNIAGVGPAIGVDAPYTTTLYVSARRGGTNDPIPGGENIFSCNVVPQGLEQGALYYLDGDPDHETEVDVGGTTIKVPTAFRSVTLGSNAGAASFHFHAGNTAGTATITCAVTDPQSNKEVTTQLQINVGQATGKASQVRINRSAPGFLFAQNTNGATQLQVQAQVLDEAGQRVADPAAGVRNLYAIIVNDTTVTVDDDALLRSPTDGGSRKWVLARTTNGQADFAVVSGSATGTLLIEVVADRFDNNVDNGIAEAVRNRFSVPVVISVGQEALGIATPTGLPAAVEGRPYATILSATGGVPPYQWEFVPGSVPPGGLTVSTDGVVTGTPVVNGTFRFALRVSDSSTVVQSVTKEFAMTIAPATGLLAIETSALPSAQVSLPYRAAVVAEGGTPPYKWTMEPTASTFSIDNNSGVISGIPATSAAGPHNIVVTVTDGKGTVVRQNFVITVAQLPETTQTETGN